LGVNEKKKWKKHRREEEDRDLVNLHTHSPIAKLNFVSGSRNKRTKDLNFLIDVEIM